MLRIETQKQLGDFSLDVAFTSEGRVTGLTKADGRPDAPIAWLWTVRDGRIVSYHNNDLE